MNSAKIVEAMMKYEIELLLLFNLRTQAEFLAQPMQWKDIVKVKGE